MGRSRANATTAYRGVSRVNNSATWRARIKYNKKDLDLGTFEDARDAARAYDDAAKELYGDKAILNFPNRK